MHRVVASSLFLVVAVAVGQAQAPNKQTSIAFVQGLQRPNGAFAVDAKKDTPGALPGTSSSLRAIKYFGGDVQDKEQCGAFLRSCRDKESGGFAPTPGGKVDVRTTAIGIMACKELGVKFDDDFQRAVDYLAKNSKTFEDMRIAAAGFESSKLPNPATLHDWIATIEKGKNPDGTYGQGGNVARDTAGTVVTLMRLGHQLNHTEVILKTLQAGQQKDGGWAKEGEKSDLETTYRVLRGFVMLKGKPDVAACQGFIAKCRNDDGGYGLQPGQPSTASGTYFAAVSMYWLEK